MNMIERDEKEHKTPSPDSLSINRVNRSISALKEKFDEDNFVDAPPDVRVGFIWELTKEIFSLTGKEDAEQRLQRDVAALIE